ncbi:hypothetical protein [Terrisporobacter petrolearius]|uniref:hypothetical protein n=1 Tax=Terrisporobacter petrolearius TaxID=1460447 RepID=UPI0031CC4D33
MDEKIVIIESELSIITIKELFKLNLAIPEYQRPYHIVGMLNQQILCLWIANPMH